ncbi:ABC transporter substrate-binding protein [Fusibacter sp. 3D3]|uniref:ABC transporter substrate-binding protein n=1 Tax=Fusibacter sp. 3D3 TaxID=1048380 RepID=UPI0008534CF2|nr:ABC transporter substrate-binding protein [Fusibacter sp. 3D3]GAU78864.1 hypothetical protein F3D3_3500 [Fusibacter sp. 3D3]
MSVNLFWNNICLISKLEESYLHQKCSQAPENIETTFFGLGRQENMLDHVKKTNHLNCDIIVSTDTDIFHDLNHRHLFEGFLPLKKFISIPLILVINQKALGTLSPPTSFKDLFKKEYAQKYVFGGPHNSAGKSLLKSIWYHYGFKNACAFVENAKIENMPAAAFQKAMKGDIPIAIVPTIFSLRMGLNTLTAVWPKDGAIPIHSYIAIRSTLKKSVSEYFINEVLGADFQEYLVQNAAILPHHPSVKPPFQFNETEFALMEPSWDFLINLDHQKLYALLSN